jgi:hypothetical protein
MTFLVVTPQQPDACTPARIEADGFRLDLSGALIFYADSSRRGGVVFKAYAPGQWLTVTRAEELPALNPERRP